MRVYVESNFVLEAALAQEQAAACGKILDLAEQRSVDLFLPAFCLAEPYHTLGGRHIQRQELSQRLGRELQQLSRSAPLTEQTNAHREAVAFLTRVGEDEALRHRQATKRLLTSAQLLPLDREVIERSWDLELNHDLTGPDAIVLASVLMHLERARSGDSLFLTKNAKDFEDPDIVANLTAQDCALLTNFDHGLARIEAKLRHESGA